MSENMLMYDDMPICPLCLEGELDWTTASEDTLICMSCNFSCKQSRAIMLLIHTMQNEVGSLRRLVKSLQAQQNCTDN